MSFLSDIQSYWSSNVALISAVPFSRVYTGLLPASLHEFPYVVVNATVTSPMFTTGPYIENFKLTISVYDTDLDRLEATCNVVTDQFDFHKITTGYLTANRSGGPSPIVDPDSPKTVFHNVILYDIGRNRTPSV